MSLANQLKSYRESQSETDRITQVHTNYRFYNNDNIYDLVKGYTFTDKEDLFVLRNYVPAIANVISGLLYTFEPKREFGDEKQKELIERVYEYNDGFFFESEKNVVLGGTTSVKVAPVPDQNGNYSGDIDIINYPASSITIKCSDNYPRRVVAVGVYLPLDGEDFLEVYTNDLITTYIKSTSSDNSYRLNSTKVNSYGYIPFVFNYYEVPTGSYSNTPITQVVALNKTLIYKLTDLNYVQGLMSFNQPIFKVKDPKKLKKNILSPKTVPVIGLEENVIMINKDAKVAENLSLVRELEKMIHECSEVPRVATTGKDEKGYSSGTALRVQKQPLRNLFDRRSRTQSKFEKRLAQMILNINHSETFGANSSSPTLDNYNVNFSIKNVYSDTPYNAFEYAAGINAGMLKSTDFIKLENPEFSDEEVEAYFQDAIRQASEANSAVSTGLKEVEEIKVDGNSDE